MLGRGKREGGRVKAAWWSAWRSVRSTINNTWHNHRPTLPSSPFPLPSHILPTKRWLAPLLALALAGCGQPPLYQQTGFVFGTKVDIAIWGLPEPVAARHAAAVLAELDRLHARLHPWQPSPLTQLNAALARGEAGNADAELVGLIEQARGYARRSDQLFNPAIGGLIGLWGFHADQYAARLPDPARVAAQVAAHPTLDDLQIVGSSIGSTNPAVQLDFGGFAKGWALDRSANYLRRHRVYNALINIGGNVLALGRKGEEPWKVGLQHPRQPRAMAVIALRDGEAIGTSGDYQRYFEVGGRRYSHLLDPRTGQPARTMQSATVIAPPSLEAGAVSDAATKPIFIGGREHALDYAGRFGVGDVLLVANDGSVFVSASMQPRLQWLVPPPHLYRLR
ncbi:FAD:protein FMN transferase [Chitiniphilus shinanonensis]|uniref:FAD:protein FMN transferase n=1 Tax=Chitiniphilus shinanonensis TaxID=553088 RepID=A0ABQ6BY07_9NEIS|nr:FAD:protein FMN transferase [Chitiniphilus shinanonensis]